MSSLVTSLAIALLAFGCDTTVRPRHVTVEKAEPAPGVVVPHHASHEHAHGAHPHSRSDHHHHQHPHPHLAATNGHHHPY